MTRSRMFTLMWGMFVTGSLSLLFDCATAFSSARRTTATPGVPTLPRVRPRRRHTAPHHSLTLKKTGEQTSSLSLSVSPVGGVVSARQLQQSITTLAASAVLFAAVLLSPISIHLNVNSNAPPSSTAHAPRVSVGIGRSQAMAMTENQQFVADVWFAVTAQFFDPSFNGLGEDGWRAKEQQALRAVADTGPDDEAAVAGAIDEMLAALGDPYTRWLPPEKYAALTAYATGGAGRGGGIGAQLLEDPRGGGVVVMGTTRGGPAAAAGVRPGDAIVRVDGESMAAASADVVAAKCRGELGTRVELEILRGSGSGESSGKGPGKASTERITLTRAKINVNPIEASTFVSEGGNNIGVLRVPSFSTNTVAEMVEGLRSARGAANGKALDALAIDLRGNVGGYMPAGVDAAKLFLPAGAHIVAEVGRPGDALRAYDADGVGAETGLPVYLLVDRRTASAAEIFAAALQDNRRATVVGTGPTFGKGRIQNVQALDGGGVAVTRARYITPRGTDLHGRGITPNAEPGRCESSDTAKTCLAGIVDGR